MSSRAVNAKQLDVLKWVIDGCPDGVMVGHTYKTTALALQSRRLVTVSKKGGIWRAEATDAGRYYAEHGMFPTDHWATSATGIENVTAVSHPAKRDVPAREPVVTGLRPVEQLLADLAARRR